MAGFPGQSMTPGYTSSPQIPADIWATPTPVQHPPPPPQAAPRAPPGLQGTVFTPFDLFQSLPSDFRFIV